MTRSRGRTVPPARTLQPGERELFGDAAIINKFDPGLRENIRMLGLVAQERGGGALLVVIDETTLHGIAHADYTTMDNLDRLVQHSPQHKESIIGVVRTYNPATEAIVIGIEVTPTLPGPQVWFVLWPLTDPMPTA
jgi:hypothetical protein